MPTTKTNNFKYLKLKLPQFTKQKLTLTYKTKNLEYLQVKLTT